MIVLQVLFRTRRCCNTVTCLQTKRWALRKQTESESCPKGKVLRSTDKQLWVIPLFSALCSQRKGTQKKDLLARNLLSLSASKVQCINTKKWGHYRRVQNTVVLFCEPRTGTGHVKQGCPTLNRCGAAFKQGHFWFNIPTYISALHKLTNKNWTHSETSVWIKFFQVDGA
jgi:hypothetical protein